MPDVLQVAGVDKSLADILRQALPALESLAGGRVCAHGVHCQVGGEDICKRSRRGLLFRRWRERESIMHTTTPGLLPNWALVASKTAGTDDECEKSALMEKKPSSVCLLVPLLEATATSYPSRANRLATALPMRGPTPRTRSKGAGAMFSACS